MSSVRSFVLVAGTFFGVYVLSMLFFEKTGAALLTALIVAVLVMALIVGELNVGRFGLVQIVHRKKAPVIYWTFIGLLLLCLVCVAVFAGKRV